MEIVYHRNEYKSIYLIYVSVGSNLGAFCAPFIAGYMGSAPDTAMRNAGWMYVVMSVVVIVVLTAVSAKRKDR